MDFVLIKSKYNKHFEILFSLIFLKRIIQKYNLTLYILLLKMFFLKNVKSFD